MLLRIANEATKVGVGTQVSLMTCFFLCPKRLLGCEYVAPVAH